MRPAPLHRVVATDPFIGRVLAGRFKVVERIGEGGMSRIYKAASTESGGETVAVKILHGYLQRQEDAVARFHNEVKAASKIGHPGIITVLDSGALPDGTVYMIQELLKGEDWREVLERSGAQPIGHAVQVIRKVCDGVGAAHEKGIIHRDLKPANVFLDARKSEKLRVKVLDFGVSKMRDDDQGLTATDSTMGTVAYMSPEQLRGAKFVDARSDIWALGIMLYEALAGHKPFEAETMAMTATKILKDPTPRLRAVRPDVPAGLWKVIYKCLQKNPEKRYQRCAELKDALAPYINLETTAVVQTADLGVGGYRYAYIAIAAAVVLFAGALWWTLSNNASEGSERPALPELRTTAAPPRVLMDMIAQSEFESESESALMGPQPPETESEVDVDDERPVVAAESMSTMRARMRPTMRRVPMTEMIETTTTTTAMMRTEVMISLMDF